MKLAVFSDSHGNPDIMLRAIGSCAPDMIIHLGDGGYDIVKIKRQFPRIPLKAVQGNCDISSNLPKTELFSVKGVRLFITHGHLYKVKSSLSLLTDEAVALGADAVLYGHTHIADIRQERGIFFINPGTCGYPPAMSFAELIITNTGQILSNIVGL